MAPPFPSPPPLSDSFSASSLYSHPCNIDRAPQVDTVVGLGVLITTTFGVFRRSDSLSGVWVSVTLLRKPHRLKGSGGSMIVALVRRRLAACRSMLGPDALFCVM